MIVSYIYAAYIGVISWWLENNMPCTLSSMAEQVIRINMRSPIKLLENYLY
ncbi:TetR-like C-terminal domain-containing protein [Bacillus pseudomycoides]|uniref:TetR-like C-terminal domain-containing protein n=1 Tax=Bacillus pseudomycoides TaxID=64104 RepID=UPI001481F18C